MDTLGKKGKFAIVKFTEEDDALGVVPLCWVQNDGTTCLYPNATTESKRNKLLRDEVMPSDSWTSHSITIMKNYATYKDARENLRKAEETSNLDSEEDVAFSLKRKRKAREIVLPGEESSSSDEAAAKKPRLPSRVPNHPYPSLETFSPLATVSIDTLPSPPRASSQWQSSPINNSSPTSSNNTLPSPTCASSLWQSSHINKPSAISSNNLFPSPTRASNHWQSSPINKSKKGNPSLLDIDRLWLILGQLQATAASQSEEISLLNQKLDLILAQGANCNTSQNNEERDHLLNSLPLTSMAEFDEFEEKLKTQEFRTVVVKLLATLGGKEPKLLMFNCMKRCLTSELGMSFSYTGKPSKDRNKEKKRAFFSTLLCAAIKSSIRKIYPTTTEEQVKINLGHWLQQAKKRTQTPRVVGDTTAVDSS